MEYYKKPDEEFLEAKITVAKTVASEVEEFFIKSGALGSYELLYSEGETRNLEEDNTYLYFFFEKSFPLQAFIPMAMEVLGIKAYESRVESKKYADYLNSMEETFHTFLLSEGLWLIPPWDLKTANIPQNDKKIIIKPSFAFGTGKHETTILMLEYIQSHIEEGDKVVEVGCGTGILCIASLLYNAAQAWGTDVENLSIQNSHENLEYNREAGLIQGSCEFYEGDFATYFEQKDPLGKTGYVFLSNILPKIFYQNTDLLKRYLLNARAWALSGINNESANEFESHLALWVPEQNFRRKKRGEWNIFYKSS